VAEYIAGLVINVPCSTSDQDGRHGAPLPALQYVILVDELPGEP